jgi:ribosomal protein S18 acetylase RimI-like enzyme
MSDITIRRAIPSDSPQLRWAVVELQDHESRLHPTRLPGELADAYLEWVRQQASESGTVLVAEIDGTFVGFVAGWIEEEHNIAETLDSNRFGYISDVCVLPAYRGRRIAPRLLDALERHFGHAGVKRVRINSLAANGSARASYEYAGFVEYEVIYEKIIQGLDAP